MHTAKSVKSVHFALNEEAYNQRHYNCDDWLSRHKFLDLKKCAICLKIQGRLSVNIVDNFHADDNPEDRTDISVPQMAWLCAPE